MKKITKIMLIMAGVLTAISMICTVAAFAMGLTTERFVKMIQDGRFSIDAGDFHISLGEEGIYDFEGEVSSTEIQGTKITTCEIEELCTSMEIEFGAGWIEIGYADVEHIEIDFSEGYKPSIKVKNGTLVIKANTGIGIHDSKLDTSYMSIKIPRDMQFDEITMELGASQADIENLDVNKLDVEVGAGQATISSLVVKEMELKVGVGQLDIAMYGRESDYNYRIECGVGEIQIGDTSYSGLASEHAVYNADIKNFIDVECGIGKVNIKFGL